MNLKKNWPYSSLLDKAHKNNNMFNPFYNIIYVRFRKQRSKKIDRE